MAKDPHHRERVARSIQARLDRERAELDLLPKGFLPWQLRRAVYLSETGRMAQVQREKLTPLLFLARGTR